MTNNINRYQPRVAIPEQARLGFWEDLTIEALAGFDEIHLEEDGPKAYFRSLAQIDYTDIQEIFSVDELLGGVRLEIRDTLRTFDNVQSRLDYLSCIWSRAREVSLKTKFVSEYKTQLDDEKDPMIGADPDRVVKLEARVRLFEGLQNLIALEERRVKSPSGDQLNGVEATGPVGVKALESFFTEEGAKLIPFIKKEYFKASAASLVPLLFALEEFMPVPIALPKQEGLLREELHQSLIATLGINFGISAFNRAIKRHALAKPAINHIKAINDAKLRKMEWLTRLP